MGKEAAAWGAANQGLIDALAVSASSGLSAYETQTGVFFDAIMDRCRSAQGCKVNISGKF